MFPSGQFSRLVRLQTGSLFANSISPETGAPSAAVYLPARTSEPFRDQKKKERKEPKPSARMLLFTQPAGTNCET